MPLALVLGGRVVVRPRPRRRSRCRNERLGARTQRAAKAACRAGRAGRVGSVEGCGSLQPTTRGGPARGCGLIASRAGSSVEWRSFEPSGSKKTARGCPARGSARAAALARCSAECPQPVAPRPQEACKRADVSQTRAPLRPHTACGDVRPQMDALVGSAPWKGAPNHAV